MSLEILYKLFGYMSTAGILIVAIFAIWYIICVCKDSNKTPPAFGMIVSAILLVMVLFTHIGIESKVYPAGQCPNCNQSVKTRYCEDCGWQNDSYHKITDR